MSVCACVYVNMYADTHRSQKRALDLLELELQALHSYGLLGTKLAKAESPAKPLQGSLRLERQQVHFQHNKEQPKARGLLRMGLTGSLVRQDSHVR